MHRHIIPSAFSIKRIGTLVGNLLGLIQPLLKILSRYFYRIYNSLYKRLQIGIYGSVQLSFKLIIQLYSEFCCNILASSLEKILVYFLYTSGRLEPIKVKATIIQNCTSRSQQRDGCGLYTFYRYAYTKSIYNCAVVYLIVIGSRLPPP